MLNSPKKNTLTDGLIEKASLDEVDDIDEIESKLCIKTKKLIDRGKRSTTLSVKTSRKHN